MSDPAVVTCALTGVLTNPDKYPVPVTPEEMAREAKRAWDAGATVVHCHFRRQEPGMGFLPTWEPDVCAEIVSAIRDACDLGYLVTLVPDACATYTQERHDNTLRAIKGYCRQRTTDELLAEIGEAKAA